MVPSKALVRYTPLSEKLFINPFSKKIRKMALSTNFVTGMAAGTLPLHEYRKFLVQDAAYFLNVAEVYGKNAKLMEGKK